MAERPSIEFRKLRLGYAVQILLKILGKALPVILRVRRSHHIQNLRKPDVLRRSSRKHPVVPTGHPELLPVINGETPLVQFQRDVSGFARGQSDLLESLQLLFGPQVVRRGIFHIQLYNFGTGCITGVGDIQRDAQFPTCICLAAQFQIGVSKGRIAQTVSKGKADRNTEAVIIPVSDIDTLPVFHVIAAGSKEIGAGGVFYRVGPGLCQLPTGIYLPCQQVRAGLANGFPAEVHLQNTPDLVFKRHIIGCAAERHKDDIGICFADFAQQTQLIGRHCQHFPVIAFPLVLVGQTAEKQNGFLIGDELQRLGLQFRVFLIPDGIAWGIGNGNAQITKRIDGAGHVCGMDMAAPAALKAHVLCQTSNDGHIHIWRERENPVIFQKYRAFAS